MKQVTECRVCKSTDLHKYLDLGSVPLCNSLLTQYSPITEKYPIQVLFCEDCFLSQLSVVIDPKILYTDYVYHSSVSQTFKKHCNDLALKLKNEFKFEHPLVIDIASNDGCCLKEFESVGFNRLLGFDPAKNLAKYPYKWVDGVPPDNETGISVVNDFFSEKIAKGVKGGHPSYYGGGYDGAASFIIAQNVFAHVDDLDDFLRGINWMLDTNGVFIVEVPYLINLIRGNQFDTIYHEHLSYFLLAPLMELFYKHNLLIFRVEHIDIHGGSIRIYASKNAYDEEKSVEDMLEYEFMQGFYELSIYTSFGKKVDSIRNNLRNELETLYKQQFKVMGYGASAKGISLLNYCGIQTPYIQYIVDDTPAKQEKMTPGSHIEIVSFEEFERHKPDYILLLAWNFAAELRQKTKHLGAKYIIPIPDVRIV